MEADARSRLVSGETVITGIGQGYMLVTPLQLRCRDRLPRQPRAGWAAGTLRRRPAQRKLELERPHTLGAIPMPQALNWDSIRAR
jgi:hypothetical protein